MAGSSIGTILRLTTFGESHGAALGAVLDGFPAGVPLSEADLAPYLLRRAPGRNAASTTRKEPDQARILSGVFEGKTTGAPIAFLIENTAQNSSDYDALRDLYRPGHADFTFDKKYGFRDHTGGGRSSGRETVARVAAGAACQKLLQSLSIDVCACVTSIGTVVSKDNTFDRARIASSPVAMSDEAAEKEALAAIAAAKEAGDSLGGTITCRIRNCPAGLGDPVFDKLDALLCRAVMSIGAVKAVEIGDGFAAAKAQGSAFNDAFTPSGKATNHAGGILGGISDGDDILLRVHVKPTPSVSASQQTIDRNGEAATLSIRGRHDPVIAPRAAVVVECMCALVLTDALLVNMGARLDSVKSFYGR